jgi:hypothetical protein
MDNKKYIDKVIEHLVRSTKIDYENEIMTFPFSTSHPLHFIIPFFRSLPSVPNHTFKIYCKNTFGLTGEEIKYVFKQYREIILSKIEDGQ